MKLILRLIAGITAGVLIGLSAPLGVLEGLVTFKELFGKLLGFIVPLVIVFYVISGISSLHKGSVKLVTLTVALAYFCSVLAGFFAYLVGLNLMPALVDSSIATVQSGTSVTAWFSIDIPPLMSVSTALLTAFVFGIGLSITQPRELCKVVDQSRAIMGIVLARAVLPCLPFYVCCVFAEMAAEGAVFNTLKTFASVLFVTFILHWCWLLLQYTVVGATFGRNPFAMIRTMLPAYTTAASTLSSIATIPVTLQSARLLGSKRSIVEFVIPLCATIHLSGSMISITVCTLSVMLLTTGSLPDSLVFVPFILALGGAMIAAPGIPGGGIMASVGLLGPVLGFDDAAIALMFALYLAQDSFGTACNVTGDGAIAAIVDRVVSDGPSGAVAAER